MVVGTSFELDKLMGLLIPLLLTEPTTGRSRQGRLTSSNFVGTRGFRFGLFQGQLSLRRPGLRGLNEAVRRRVLLGRGSLDGGHHPGAGLSERGDDRPSSSRIKSFRHIPLGERCKPRVVGKRIPHALFKLHNLTQFSITRLEAMEESVKWLRFGCSLGLLCQPSHRSFKNHASI